MKRKKKNGHLLYLRTIRIWNTLSDELNLGMNNVDDFKHALMCYYSTALLKRSMTLTIPGLIKLSVQNVIHVTA